jgi:flagellar P-ring protein FlgI
MRTLLLSLLAATLWAADTGVRIKDLCEIAGVRDNQLHGIGIVVGLTGTGDKSAATVRMLRQLLATKNLSFTESDLASKNVAMVAITADLPAFARAGSRLATQASCIGDASSLRGGILLQTPLVAADGRIYAVAQGPVSVGGFGSAGPTGTGGGTEHKNVETVAICTPGAIVEREVPTDLLLDGHLRLILRQSDFTTANRIADRLAELMREQRLEIPVQATDAATVTLTIPRDSLDAGALTKLLADMQQIAITPDVAAKVVINARTGTIVAGNRAQIGAVAVSHAGLSLRVAPQVERVPDPERPGTSMERTIWVDPATRSKSPAPPAGTRPSAVPGTFTVIEGATVDDIATALNALGARPRDLVAIFEAIQRAGALHAELVVM